MRCSDPFHGRYGQHLSAEEVHQLVAPKSQSITAVNAWLASHGVLQGATRSPALDWVNVKIPVALAEEMLDTVRVPSSQYNQHIDTLII